MRFQNKILKLSLRYAKENGIYYAYLKAVRNLIIKYNYNETQLIKRCMYGTPLLIMNELGILPKDIYSNEFVKYICDIHKETLIKFFDDFLKSHNIKKQFHRNLEKKFILRNIDITFPPKTLPFIMLVKAMPPTGFFMYGFSWANTQEGHAFWLDINQQWIKEFINKVNEISK